MAAARATAFRLAAYGALGLPLAMAALPIYVHVPKFYADTLGLSLAGVGAILLAVRLLDAVQDPLLGWWSDRRRAAGGTRWPFVAWGTAFMALGMAGLFNPPEGGSGMLSAWLVANLVVVYTAFSMVTVSYQAHGAEIADDPAERTRVTAWREGFALVGVFLAAALPEVLKQSIGDRAGFAAFALVFGPLALAAMAITVRASPPAHGRAPPPGGRCRSPRWSRRSANPVWRWLPSPSASTATWCTMWKVPAIRRSTAHPSAPTRCRSRTVT